MRTIIFPNIEILEFPNAIQLFTNVRKPYKKYIFSRPQYYLWPHLITYRFKDKVESDERTQALHRFLHDIYNTILFGKVEPDLLNTFRHKIYTLDPNQESEMERLNPHIK